MYFRLDDFENSCAAYEKAIELGSDDLVTHINYAITLYNNDEIERARKQFSQFQSQFEMVRGEKEIDQELIDQYEILQQYLDL